MDRLETMRLFTRIAELGSFSRAAEQLGLARASATQSIKQLEARLGVRLLLRTTRQVTPTADGEAYYQRCLVILNDVDDLEAEFSHAGHNPQGRIRIDLSGSLCRLVLLPSLPHFCATYPQINLDITVSDRHIDLIREGVDCVLRFGGLGDIPHVARPLAQLPQVTCASADYLQRNGTPRTLADLVHHRVVDYIPAPNAKPAPLEFVIDGTIERRNLPATVSINSGEAYVAACEAGFGIIQVPLYHVARQLAAGSLCELLPDWRPPTLPLNVLYPPNRQLSARVRAFIDWLEELFGDNLAAARP
jgi:LysR family transcriptional regulator for bpeEF and oprC